MQPDILEELYQNYYDAAYAYTLSLCKNREDTEDLVADAFVKALFSYENETEHFNTGCCLYARISGSIGCGTSTSKWSFKQSCRYTPRQNSPLKHSRSIGSATACCCNVSTPSRRITGKRCYSIITRGFPPEKSQKSRSDQ